MPHRRSIAIGFTCARNRLCTASVELDRSKRLSRNLPRAEHVPITPDMKTSLRLHSLILLALLAPHWAFAAEPDKDSFVPIFDGKTLNGWHASAKTRSEEHTSELQSRQY